VLLTYIVNFDKSLVGYRGKKKIYVKRKIFIVKQENCSRAARGVDNTKYMHATSVI